MCGIIGYTGKKNAVPIILDGLKRLEYRGYDSAGIAFFREKGIEVRKCTGKIKDLYSVMEADKPFSHTAIGHTRWATHGKPSEENAHPHRSDGIVLVHNGIIENYLPLKKKLIEEGYKFTSETDTEVICHLIEKYSKDFPLEDAVRRALSEVKGAYALAVMNEKEPGKIVGIKKDSPLVIGLGDGEFFLASDVPAFLSHSRDVIFLDEGEMVVMTEDGVMVTTLDGLPVKKEVISVSWSPSMAEKGGYRHFMLKEIYEQPRAIADTMRGRFYPESGEVNLDEFGIDKGDLKELEKIFIVACGTSWHAALIGKYLIEEIARVPVEVDIASEFRYRNPILGQRNLLIAITQSGETADTLAAQREAKRLGAKVLSICNVVGSTASREAQAVFYTHSGPEIGVASTKAFTTQIIGLYLFAIGLARLRGAMDKESTTGLLRDLLFLPGLIEKVLTTDGEIAHIAKELFKADDFLYLGRGINYPIALEGALKLKEISYIHAEGYPAGEMKHGPIALVDEAVPSVFLAPKGRLYDKVLSNIEEVRSRGGRIIAVTNEGSTEVRSRSDYCIFVPETNPFLMAVLLAVPLQLLAYHIGVLRGCDVDQPRNLAKSVTVE
ncbi:MAG: glutamine--fructose-6-phosphate transaminase (isomerizing) [Thermodesulfovibrionales bacterium]|nr:glutamine--fructose-6-phosphate transaminase (isomerizing) [Thermodesulfovibrionales bacterium]